MTHKQKLAIANLWDPHHCSHNATWDAVAAAGFQAAIEQGIIIVNVPYGPYLRGGFHSDIESAAMEASVSLTANDALVMLFWNDICESRMWVSAEDTGEEARARWLAELPISFPATVQGYTASKNDGAASRRLCARKWSSGGTMRS